MQHNVIDIGVLRDYKDRILALAETHKAENIRVFGSVARGDAGIASDIDLLVHFKKGASLFDIAGLGEDLSELLKKEVDIVPDDSLHWFIRDRILQEAVPL